ncbi:MAG TPA: FKBP-type peptidyl-prolyl cis-trans isomerase [Azoarcus sp.]|nr:FKBP-type peptidyl-prolyl cis-trans isomerase [Azoarcus sp.]
MQVLKDTVVTLTYTVTDSDGATIDDGSDPLVYLHGGYDGIFPAIEEALQGKSIGDSFRLKLQPEDAFGDYDEQLVLVEEKDVFPENIEIGMAFERVGDEGEEDMIFRITDIADDKIIIDGNHPLAGMSLIFDGKVTEVRKATPEEISHGHVHGEGGHHH